MSEILLYMKSIKISEHAQKSLTTICDSKHLDNLEKVGIKTNQILIHKPKNRTKMYYFSITGKENILLFNQKIGFLHPIKKEKLKILVEKYRRT